MEKQMQHGIQTNKKGSLIQTSLNQQLKTTKNQSMNKRKLLYSYSYLLTSFNGRKNIVIY